MGFVLYMWFVFIYLCYKSKISISHHILVFNCNKRGTTCGYLLSSFSFLHNVSHTIVFAFALFILDIFSFVLRVKASKHPFDIFFYSIVW